MDRRRAWAASLVVAVALVLGAALVAGGAAGPASAHANHVTVGTQVVGDAVVVESAFTSIEGFLVVHADDGGDPGRVLGHRRVGRGEVSNLRLPVTGELPPGNATLWVVLHEDDGDGEFAPADDPPVESFGSLVGTRFPARGGTPAHVTASRFGDRFSNGSLAVDRAALPADGYVVVRTDRGGTPGRVVGHRALGAGTHGNVTVALNDSFLADAPDRFGLWVTVYRDDGDGAFDRAERVETDAGLEWTAGDRPVTVDGAPVTTLTNVNRGGGVAVNTATDPGGGGTSGPTDGRGHGVGAGLRSLVVGLGVVVVVGLSVAAAVRARQREG